MVYGADITGSSDIGDLSSILPVIQPSVGGFAGALHEQQFHVTEKQTAYVLPAKIVAMTVAELLYHHAETAKQIKKSFEAKLTKEEYRNYLEGKV